MDEHLQGKMVFPPLCLLVGRGARSNKIVDLSSAHT